jgi:hypothetical protein
VNRQRLPDKKLRSRPFEFIQLDSFYYLVVRDQQSFRLFRVQPDGSIKNLTADPAARLIPARTAGRKLVMGNRVLFIQPSTAGAGFTLVLADSGLQVLHRQEVSSFDHKPSSQFTPLNDSIVLIRSILNGNSQPGQLAMSRLNVFNGYMTHRKLTAQDGYFVYFSLHADGRGKVYAVAQTQMLASGPAQGQHYSFLLQMDEQLNVEKNLPLDQIALQDSLQLSDGFQPSFTALEADGSLVHIDRAVKGDPWQRFKGGSQPAPVSKAGEYIRFSTLKRGADSLQWTGMHSMPVRPYLFLQGRSGYLGFYPNDLGRNRHRISGFRLLRNGRLQSFDLNLPPTQQSILTEAFLLDDRHLLVPFTEKRSLGFVVVNTDNLQ